MAGVFLVCLLGFMILGFVFIGLPMLIIASAIIVWFVIDVMRAVNKF